MSVVKYEARDNVATSIPRVMKPAGLEKSTGIVSSSYMKGPADPQWKNDKDMNDWRAFMKKYYPDGNIGSSFNVYGWSVAKTLEHVLKNAGDNLTRANIMKQAASIKKLKVPGLLPGITISTGANDFRPIEQMQLQKFNGKSWDLFGPIISGEAGS